MNKIIISGKANSGKNTLANLLGTVFDERYIKNNFAPAPWGTPPHKPYYKVFAFADPIKQMIMQMYPDTDTNILWGASDLRMTKIPNCDKTFRKLLTDLGQLGRSYDLNVWANATIASAKKYANEENCLAVIADLRFKAELNAVPKDFFKIRIIRPDNFYQQLSESKDISETDLDDISDSVFDAVIFNDGSLEQLKEKVTKLSETIFN